MLRKLRIISVSVSLSICPSVCVRLSVCLSVCPSVCVRLSICLSICPSVCVRLSVCLSICPSVCVSLSVCQFVRPSVCICLSVCQLSYCSMHSGAMTSMPCAALYKVRRALSSVEIVLRTSSFSFSTRIFCLSSCSALVCKASVCCK